MGNCGFTIAPVPAGAPRAADGDAALRRRHADRGVASRHPLGVGDLPRVPRRRGAMAARGQRGGVHRPLGRALLRHGRGGGRASGDGRRAAPHAGSRPRGQARRRGRLLHLGVPHALLRRRHPRAEPGGAARRDHCVVSRARRGGRHGVVEVAPLHLLGSTSDKLQDQHLLRGSRARRAAARALGSAAGQLRRPRRLSEGHRGGRRGAARRCAGVPAGRLPPARGARHLRRRRNRHRQQPLLEADPGEAGGGTPPPAVEHGFPRRAAANVCRKPLGGCARPRLGSHLPAPLAGLRAPRPHRPVALPTSPPGAAPTRSTRFSISPWRPTCAASTAFRS